MKKHLIVFLLLSLSLHLTIVNADLDLDGTNSHEKWLTVKGAPIGAFPGRAVSNIGDFNGDGIDDILINAANHELSEIAYVIYGHKNGYPADTIALDAPFSEGFAINGPFIDDEFTNFGHAISKKIDLNGDGLGDIVLGAHAYSDKRGIVYVIYGKKGHTGDITINQDYSLSASDGFVIFGPQENSRFGYAVGSAGDFNGDGFADLMIGAPDYENGQGAVFVIYGKNGKYTSNIDLETTSAGFTILGEAGNYNLLGEALDGVGDINGDGVDDILVGASNEYSVYGLYGKKNRVETSITVDSSFDASKGFAISSSEDARQFGRMLSSAGDINGDGIQDIILGSFSKGALVLYGRKEDWSSFDIDYELSSSQGFRIKDSRATAATPFVIAATGGGDINGDGIDDILVRGVYVAVIYGSKTAFVDGDDFDAATNLTAETGLIVSGSALDWRKNYGPIATSVAVGDFDKDNIDDIVIGAPSFEIFAGKTYIVFGTNGCAKNCATCESSTKCFTCFEGFEFSGSACVACPGGVCIGSSRLSCSSGSKGAQAVAYKELFDVTSAISNAVVLGSSMPTSFGLVSKLLRNSKYLDVARSEDLQETFCAWKISTGIFPAPKDSSEGSLPWVFERYGIEKAFLVNYWKTFTAILLGLVLGLGCFVVTKLTFMRTNSKIPKIVIAMVSNFVLAQFYGSIDEIFLDFVLDARSDKSTSSGFRTFGLVLGVLLLLAGFGVAGLHGMALFKYQRIKKYKKLKLFFKDFQDVDVFQQSFFLINIIRSLLSSLIFSLLFDRPILQISLLIVLNIFVLIHLVKKKPFKDVINAIAQYVCEGILFIAYLSALVLASVKETSSAIKGFSMALIVCNAVLLIGASVFMLASIALILHKTYKDYSNHSSVSAKTAPMIEDSPSFKPLDHSKNLNNSRDSLEKTTFSSPNLGPRRKVHIRTDSGSPILGPSYGEGSPDVTRREEPRLLQLNLQNSERIQEELPIYEEEPFNQENGKGSFEIDLQSRLKRMRIQRLRKLYPA